MQQDQLPGAVQRASHVPHGPSQGHSRKDRWFRGRWDAMHNPERKMSGKITPEYAHVRQHANQAQSKCQRLPRTAEAESDWLSHSFGHAQDVEQPLQESVAR